MTLRRAAIYIGGASLLVAWFASAASLSLNRTQRRPSVDAAQPTSPIDDLALQVQQQSKRLRDRLVTAPQIQPAVRNPFAFRAVTPPSKPTRPSRSQTPVSAPVAAEAPEPALSLIGVAEENRPEGVVRIAMLVTAGEELIMVTVGEGLLQRYKVTAISVDGVELADLTTGRVRRLVLPL